MKHVLKRPVRLLLPKPQVFLAAFLAAALSAPACALAGRWGWSVVWGWLAAALAGLLAAYGAERLYFLLRRREEG